MNLRQGVMKSSLMYSLLYCVSLGKLSLQPTRGIVSNVAFPIGRLPRGLPHLSALLRN